MKKTGGYSVEEISLHDDGVKHVDNTVHAQWPGLMWHVTTFITR